jgi:hypothetical protein
MNLSTLLIAALLIVLAVLAVRYTHKHGTCESCGGSCDGHCGVKIPFDKIKAELDAEKKEKAGLQ